MYENDLHTLCRYWCNSYGNKILIKVSVTVRGVGMFMRLFEKSYKARCIKVHINKFVIYIRILSQG